MHFVRKVYGIIYVSLGLVLLPKLSVFVSETQPDIPPASVTLIDVHDYVPALITVISNRLSRGAAASYLDNFGVGIEVWRCLVLLAPGKPLSVQAISPQVGLDKSSVSRSFKKMHADDLITLSHDDHDGRLRLATITPKGMDVYHQILGLALAREQAFLTGFSRSEVATLKTLLLKLDNNLAAVEDASADYVARDNEP